MYYARLCLNCGQGFTAMSKRTMFCCKDCRINYHNKKAKTSNKVKVSAMDKVIRKDWEDTETNPTKCYKCGAVIDYWTYDYAARWGRVCKKCASEHKCNKMSNKITQNENIN